MRQIVFKIIVSFWLVTTVISCSALPDATVAVDNTTIINHNYIGNGVQWDPYQLDYGEKQLKISSEDRQKLYSRLDFMKPQFIRVMINTTSVIENGVLNETKNYENIAPILEYCQSRNVKVVLGDWGDRMVNSKTNSISETNLKFAAKYLDFLANQKGFSCIHYYNMINEPNGFWSSTNENYELWKNAASYFWSELKALNLDKKVSLLGPDIAIWKADKLDWISNSVRDLDHAIGVYDIHTYPSKITVNSGEYTSILKAYKDAVPAGKPIVMGEIGFKFVEKQDEALLNENIARAKAKPYASVEDSQMFVYDYVYGSDMADALIQTVNAGYSGSVAWMLDDAMHAKEQKNKLKVWGFWNILGDEYFGKEEEKVRPWFYSWSLLTKYMPSESQIHKVSVDGNPNLKAISVSKDGKNMIAIVNVSSKDLKVNLTSKDIPALHQVKKFVYAKDKLKLEGDHILLPNETNLTLDLSQKATETIPAEGLLVLTNFDY
ncbi:cellulase family glycosylhydrolase [Flavobacterium sp. H4147]|uniref:cellulase family glycosylhydrolase n=1 Tax=Flavobacterium sp. H4147 TaxID=3034149 RepID=UPI0023EB17EA|nr:cellulase family glycosylhydrolase [Flavobacterium sp. H4147]